MTPLLFSGGRWLSIPHQIFFRIQLLVSHQANLAADFLKNTTSYWSTCLWQPIPWLSNLHFHTVAMEQDKMLTSCSRFQSEHSLGQIDVRHTLEIVFLLGQLKTAETKKSILNVCLVGNQPLDIQPNVSNTVLWPPKCCIHHIKSLIKLTRGVWKIKSALVEIIHGRTTTGHKIPL